MFMGGKKGGGEGLETRGRERVWKGNIRGDQGNGEASDISPVRRVKIGLKILGS